MLYIFQSNRPTLEDLSRNRNKFLILGVVFMVLGLLAMSFATLTTLISVIFLGILLLISGVMILIDTFQFWRHRGGFYLHLLVGILYALIGIVFLTGPVSASISLTLLLAIFFICIGVFRIINAFSQKLPTWGWSLFNGIITLLLGIFILMGFPETGLFFIGLFVGIDLFICGWTYIMIAIATKANIQNPK